MTKSKNHTYQIKEVDSDNLLLNNNGDVRVTVKMFDKTAQKEITRRGTAVMIGNFSPIWLDSLEGHKKVYIKVNEHDIDCKIIEEGEKYSLSDF